MTSHTGTQLGTKRVHTEKPLFIIGRRLCTMFSHTQALNPGTRGDNEEAVRNIREELGKARRHIEFCCSLDEFQMKRGAHVIHEHPWGAKSLNLECMRRLIHHAKVMIPKVDLCRFGLTTIDSKERKNQQGSASEL